MQIPGSVTLMGSGETSPMAGQIYEMLARQRQAQSSTAPLQVSVLETPAGFETNAQRVAGRVADFFKVRLQNYHPQVQTIAARQKGTVHSPDAPEIVKPLYTSNMIFLGPGSPSYTVRQLRDSLAWQVIQARQRQGANLVLASAATISISTQALPVYEIYKVGEDPHWKPGLDFFGAYGIPLVIVPHWNNREGGDEVDTSRCFMGQERFAQMRAMLPPETVILGIDEHTALTLDFEAESCIVYGVGEVHILRGEAREDCAAGCAYPISTLGEYHMLADPQEGIDAAVWQAALDAQQQSAEAEAINVPDAVQALVDARQAARKERNFARADELRGEISRLGWVVKDTPDGPEVQPDGK